MATLKIQLTQHQIDEIKKVFGEHVPEITLSLEEFNAGKAGMKFRVLKIDNIATVVDGAGMGGSVN